MAKNTSILKLAKGSLEQNKQLLDGLVAKYKVLSATQGDNSKEVKALNVQIGHLTKTVDDQEKKVTKSREVFDFHKKSVDSLKTSFGNIKESAGSLHRNWKMQLKGSTS